MKLGSPSLIFKVAHAVIFNIRDVKFEVIKYDKVRFHFILQFSSTFGLSDNMDNTCKKYTFSPSL